MFNMMRQRLQIRLPKTDAIYLLISGLVIILTGLLSCWWQRMYWVDLNLPLCSSSLLLSGKDPYSACYTDYHNQPSASYPMTTLLAFLPFLIFTGPYLAAAAIWGVFNGLLVFGLLKNGKLWLFLIFLSAPYWVAFAFHQFSPLIAAVFLLPSLLPLALLKPQLGLPVIVNHLTKRRLIALIVFIAITFIVYPGWLSAWYRTAKNYDGVIPLLVFPLNLFLLLAFFKVRDPNVRFVFLMASIPQRLFYDLAPLFLLPRTLKQMLVFCYLSWVAFLPQLFSDYWKIPANQVKLSLIFIYLPILVMLVFGSTSIHEDKAAL